MARPQESKRYNSTSCLVVCALCLLFLPALNADHNKVEIPSATSIRSTASLPSSSVFRFKNADKSVSLQRTLVGTLSRTIAKRLLLVRNFNESNPGTLSLRRHLAIGDFEEINALVKDVELELPDNNPSEDLSLTNLVCSDFNIGDILVSYQRTSVQRLAMELNVTAFDMTCNMDYNYGSWPFSTSGNLNAIGLDNNVSLTLGLTSPFSFQTNPPTNATLDNCFSEINIDDIQFSGGIIAGILNIFSGLVSAVVETEFADVVCSEGSTAAKDLASDLLQSANEFLQEFQGASVSNPLLPETSLLQAPPSNTSLMDLQDKDGFFGIALQMLRNEIYSRFGVEVDDPNGPKLTGRDLGANAFLRKEVLDQDRALVLEMNQTVLDSHDNLTHTTLEIESVRLFGLDTLTLFKPLASIGNYTLANDLAFEFLTAELDVKLTIRPSTLPDSSFQQSNANAEDIVETIKVDFGLDAIDARISALLAIDEDSLGDTPLGAILNTNSSGLLPCLLSTLHQVQLSELKVSVAGIRAPSLNGDESSSGIVRILSSLIDALFSVYEPTVFDVLPNLLGIEGLDLINNDFIKSYFDDPVNTVCAEPQAESGALDSLYIRDLKNIFQTANELLEEYLGEDVSTRDPLLPETTLLAAPPFNVSLMDFQSSKGLFGMAFQMLRDQISTFNEEVDDPDGPRENGRDLRANVFLRSEVLDQDRALALKLGMVLLESHDNLSHTTMEVVSVRLLGLDTFTKFNPLTVIGNYTLANDLALDFLTAELELRRTTRPSTLPETMVKQSDAEVTVETVKVEFGLTDLDALFSVLLAIDEDSLGDTPIGVILNTNSSGLLPCLLSTLHQLELSELNVSVAELRAPSIDDEMLPEDVLNLLSSFVDELFSVYNTTVSDALPNLIGTAGVDLVNNDFLKSYVDDPVNTICAEPPAESGALDSLYIRDVANIFHTVNEFLQEYIGKVPTRDPLLPETTLLGAPPNNITLLDLQSTEGLFGMAFKMIRDQISFFNEEVDDPDGPRENGRDLRANVFLRSDVLDQDRALTLDIGIVLLESHDNLSHSTLEVESIRLLGLDTFTKFNPLSLIGNYTLKNELALDFLTAELDLRRATRPSTLPESMVKQSVVDETTESIKVEIGLTEAYALFSVLLAIDDDALGGMPVGAILDPSGLLPCFLSTLYQAELSELNVSVADFRGPSLNGEMLSENIFDLLSSFADELFSVYNTTFSDALPNLISTGGLDLINNDVIKSYVDDPINTKCVNSRAESGNSDFIDFRDLLLTPEKSRELGGSGESQYGDLVRIIIGFIKEEALKIDSDGLSSLNDLIRPFLESDPDTPGAIVVENLFEGSFLFEVGERVADIELRAFGAKVENVDSLGAPIGLLEPVLNEPNILNNTVTLGVGAPVRAALRLVFALQDEDLQLRNEVDISIDLEAATLVLGALLRISEEPFWVFPLRDLTNFNCLIATIPAPVLDAQGFRVGGEPDAAVTDLALSMAALDFNFSCVSCTSPKLNELSDLLSSPENEDNVFEAGKMVVDLVTDLVSGDFAQNRIDRILNEAAMQCPHNDAYDPAASLEYESLERPYTGSQSVTFLVAIVAAMAFAFVIALIIYFVIRRIVRKRHRKWLMSLSSENIAALYKEQCREYDINKETQSLFTSPVIPRYVRYLLPILFLGTIALFLSGHLSLAARVSVEANLFGESFDIDKVQEFSMSKSFSDIWNAGSHELAILILIFSGVWPYSKQIITIVLWFLPPSVLSVSRRGSVFYWLDTLAKWSMVDVFMMVVSIASFRVSFENPESDILPDGLFSFQLMVVPMWGLYANMIAQLLSQVSSHFVIHYHNRVVFDASEKYDYEHPSPKTLVGDDVEKNGSNSDTSSSLSYSRMTKTEKVPDGRFDRLYVHAFVRPHRGSSDTLVIRRGINACLIVISIAIVVLVVFGCIRPSFSVEVLGIIGLGVEIGEKVQKAVSQYSVFDLVSVLMDQARHLDSAGDYLGLGILSALLIISVLVVPMIQTLMLLIHWFTPMTRQRRAKLYVVVEILQAWQYMEVYILSILAGVWQLGQVSEYLFGPYCTDLSSTFATLLYFGILESRRDARCFATELSVENGIFFMIAAAVLLALVNTFVTKAIEQYHRDTDENLLRFEAEGPRALSPSASFDPEGDVSEIADKIHPVPVMFTDLFRWLLCREDSSMAVKRNNAGQDSVEDDGPSPPGDKDQQANDVVSPVSSTTAYTAGSLSDVASETNQRGAYASPIAATALGAAAEENANSETADQGFDEDGDFPVLAKATQAVAASSNSPYAKRVEKRNSKDSLSPDRASSSEWVVFDSVCGSSSMESLEDEPRSTYFPSFK